MLANVQQATIRPIIETSVARGSLVHTDEYDVYARLEEWGYGHKTVCHGRGEYARDEDGDGFCEVHVNTTEGFWSLLRSWLRPHRGISQEKLPAYLGFFQLVHNTRRRGKALLGTLVAALVASTDATTPKPDKSHPTRATRDMLEHQRLIAEIEAGRGLVHDQQRRGLRQRAGNQRQLTLAATDPGVVGISKLRMPSMSQGISGSGQVARARPGERAEMRRPAHQHDVLHGVGKSHGLCLGDVGDAAGNGWPRPGGQRLAIQQHEPALGRHRPRRVRKRVVLPAPLGPSRHKTSPGPTARSTPRPTGLPG